MTNTLNDIIAYHSVGNMQGKLIDEPTKERTDSHIGLSSVSILLVVFGNKLCNFVASHAFVIREFACGHIQNTIFLYYSLTEPCVFAFPI